MKLEKEKIQRNNTVINKLQFDILQFLKENKIDSIYYENGIPKLIKPVQDMLDVAAKRICFIYKIEFFDVLSEDAKNFKDIEVSILDRDGMPTSTGAAFNSGTQSDLNEYFKIYNKINLDENNGIHYDENGIDAVQVNCSFCGDRNTPHLFTNDNMIENDLSMLDYISYAASTNMQDVEFFLETLPHELMHFIGYSDEGITENFTREISKEYGILMVPAAHWRQTETPFAQKLEKIVGRSYLKKAFHIRNDVDGKRQIDVGLLVKRLNKKLGGNKGELLRKYYMCDDNFFKSYRECRGSQTQLLEKLDLHVASSGDSVYSVPNELKDTDILTEKIIKIYGMEKIGKYLSDGHFELDYMDEEVLKDFFADSDEDLKKSVERYYFCYKEKRKLNGLLHESFSVLEQNLDEYICNNKDKLYELGEYEKLDTRKNKEERNKFECEVILAQEAEIESLQRIKSELEFKYNMKSEVNSEIQYSAKRENDESIDLERAEEDMPRK